MIAFETHHLLKCKNQGKEGFIALKLDMSKVYDGVNWDFLFSLIQVMNFASKWIQLIQECQIVLPQSSIQFLFMDQ
ncbi:unnamed protein product [Cuscuta epithymum]|uniref:Reverse transcriptase domain-containing protein n=1 Tax=Cuscuta epithymum TaxID=186058 RepID=A0AAV0FSE4_9ASTE|nr:unnamed protein product [Cuscuta epithymum]